MMNTWMFILRWNLLILFGDYQLIKCAIPINIVTMKVKGEVTSVRPIIHNIIPDKISLFLNRRYPQIHSNRKRRFSSQLDFENSHHTQSGQDSSEERPFFIQNENRDSVDIKDKEEYFRNKKSDIELLVQKIQNFFENTEHFQLTEVLNDKDVERFLKAKLEKYSNFDRENGVSLRNKKGRHMKMRALRALEEILST